MKKQAVIFDKKGKIESIADEGTWLVIEINGAITTCRAEDVNTLRQGIFPRPVESLEQYLSKRDTSARNTAQAEENLERQHKHPHGIYDGRAAAQVLPPQNVKTLTEQTEHGRQIAYSIAAAEDRAVASFLKNLTWIILIAAVVLMIAASG